MNKYPDDLTGLKFGTLTVLGRADGYEYENTKWLCKCECGRRNCKKSVIMRRGSLTRKTDWKLTCGASGNNAEQSAKTKFENGTVQKNSRTGVTGVNHSQAYPGRYQARMCVTKNKRLKEDNLSFRDAVITRKAWESMKRAMLLNEK